MWAVGPQSIDTRAFHKNPSPHPPPQPGPRLTTPGGQGVQPPLAKKAAGWHLSPFPPLTIDKMLSKRVRWGEGGEGSRSREKSCWLGSSPWLDWTTSLLPRGWGGSALSKALPTAEGGGPATAGNPSPPLSLCALTEVDGGRQSRAGLFLRPGGTPKRGGKSAKNPRKNRYAGLWPDPKRPRGTQGITDLKKKPGPVLEEKGSRLAPRVLVLYGLETMMRMVEKEEKKRLATVRAWAPKQTNSNPNKPPPGRAFN